MVLLDVVAEEAQSARPIRERLGHPVVTCSGPEVTKLCPLLGGEGCAKLDLDGFAAQVNAADHFS